ncbi:hypothetical protein [Gordonia sp. NB41Y]|uniref:hypothetical protein n=1 Tax=Gordonia sp. NB41Y TaxID=875808 RepID=UPI0006B176E0|nr:hypothetical protein [Gordonia sp. NB41Y]EMP10665.2 hypothetical protein ISGA_5272 [Gordonia sp. NB41Y]WLP92286.1 hypothetical protein Q9K23_08700 [Gordonia sp. NB41Y]
MQPFTPNDYRKRVLAAVERRGGADSSDSFELYDIPLEESDSLTDDEVNTRIDEVWGFWQRHRDHPKYRVLVERLVAEHPHRSAPLRQRDSRSAEARAVSDARQQRDQGRYELLDNAIERLMDRYGGIPTSKRAGLDEIGAMGGLTADEVTVRLRRYRIIDDAVAAPEPEMASPTTSLSDQRLIQITELLAEFSRRRDAPPVHTLLGFLRLDTDAITDRDTISRSAAILREQARALPAGRMRALVDELLIHVESILLEAPATADAYLRSILDGVDAALRPQIRAAVLVEDRLHPSDHQYLLEQARDLDLSTRDARALITRIAAGYGATVENPPPPPAQTRATQTPPAAAGSPGEWQAALRSARKALRSDRLDAARDHCARARAAAGDDPVARRQIDAVADEAERRSAAPTPAQPATPTQTPAPARQVTTAPPTPTTPTATTPPPAGPDLPPITGVTVSGDRLLFTWPAGVTEAVVVIRSDAPPEYPADPRATSTKVTNTRYEIDGGVVLPHSAARQGHVAVASCRRDIRGRLEVAGSFGPQAHAPL